MFIVIKIVATRCQIVRLKRTKFDFGWGSAPDPAKGSYSAYSIAGFKGTYFYREERGGKGRELEGRAWEGKVRKKEGGREKRGRGEEQEPPFG